VFDKENAAELTDMRRQICERYVRDDGYRVVEIPDPPRDRGAADYAGAVRTWRDARTRGWRLRWRRRLGPDGRGAILVWGDPALYDGTIRIIETILRAGPPGAGLPGHPGDQQRAAAHRAPSHPAEPGGPAGAHHHGPAAVGGAAARRRRRGW